MASIDRLRVGAVVRISGVRSRPEFEGRLGTVKSLIPPSADCVTHAEVEMIDISSESLRVKVERLEVVLLGSERSRKRRENGGEVQDKEGKKRERGEGSGAGAKNAGNADCIVVIDGDDGQPSSSHQRCAQASRKAVENVVDLCDSDDEGGIVAHWPLQRCSASKSATVDLSFDVDDDLCRRPSRQKSSPHHSANSSSAQWSGTAAGAWPQDDEDESDDDTLSYDESKDILAAERRTLEEWARTKFKESDCKVTEFYHNPESYPGRNLYEAFAAGFKLARHTKRIELKFHGTPECNVDSICQNGLDPAKRSGQVYGEGEYFGGCVRDSLGYCRGGSKMLIFAVLMDDSGLTFQGAGGAHAEVTVVSKSHHHVPVAVVTFSCSQPYQPHLAAPASMLSSAVAAAAASMLGLPSSSLPSGLQHLFGGGSSSRRKRRRR